MVIFPWKYVLIISFYHEQFAVTPVNIPQMDVSHPPSCLPNEILKIKKNIEKQCNLTVNLAIVLVHTYIFHNICLISIPHMKIVSSDWLRTYIKLLTIVSYSSLNKYPTFVQPFPIKLLLYSIFFNEWKSVKMSLCVLTPPPIHITTRMSGPARGSVPEGVD